MRRRRDAPSAARIVSSRCRVVARASSRLATFAHAINRTNDTAASRTSAASFTPRTTWSRSGTSLNRRPVLNRGYFAASPAAVASASARAWLERHALFQPAEHAHRPRAAREAAAVERIGAERHPQVRRRGEGQEREAGRQHADDLHRAAVERQRGADGVRGAGEATLPQRVADERDGRSARTLFRSGQRPPERGPDAEHVEEISCDDRELHLLGLGLPGHVPAPERPRGQAVVTPAFGSKILEVRLREHQLELPLVRLAAPEDHEAVRVRKGKRVEHHAVDDREHRGASPRSPAPASARRPG